MLNKYEDDPMVIILQMFNYNMKRIFINLGSSTNILYSNTFKQLELDHEHLHPFKGSIVGSLIRLQFRGCISLRVTFLLYDNSKTIKN